MKNIEQKNIFSYMKQTAETVYMQYGYKEIAIPLFVNNSLYEKYRGVPNNKLIKFLDRNGNVLVIRPDATFNILKKVSARKEKHNQRYYYHTEIVRYQSNDYENNEFMQTGIEFFNEDHPACDAEVIAIGVESLLQLGITKIRVDIGHSDFIYALFDDQKALSKKDHQKIHELIAQKNTMDLEELLQERGIEHQLLRNVIEICMLFGDYDEVIERARELCINEKMHQALNNIEQIYQILCEYGYENYIYLDLGFSNPMEYYSGMIFKIYAESAKEELISGGRYDRFSAKFGHYQSACGFGHNLNLSSELIENDVCRTNMITVNTTEDQLSASIAEAKNLRGKGYSVVIQLGDHNQIDYKQNIYKNFPELYQVL